MEIREYGPYNEGEMLSLYNSAKWTYYTERPDMLRQAFERSLCVLAAYEGDALMGILRAVGDGCSIVFIQDIIVFPEYRRRGAGSALMRAVMERYGIEVRYALLTDDRPGLNAFYYDALDGVEPAYYDCKAYVWM